MTRVEKRLVSTPSKYITFKASASNVNLHPYTPDALSGVGADISGIDVDISGVGADLGTSLGDAMDAVKSFEADSGITAAAAEAAAQNGPQRMEGILSPISDNLEKYLFWVQDNFRALGVPGPVGSSIIFTTFLVKALTFPLTKAQVESSLNMKNLAPQVRRCRLTSA